MAVLEAVDSTHATALRLIAQVEHEGLCLRPTVVVAVSQSCGVGRGARRWNSPPGGLYLNWLGSNVSDDVILRLPMIAAAAAHSAVASAGVTHGTIKWPNDILVDGRKLAGLLIHSRGGDSACVTVGLGINLRPVQEPLETPIHPPISLEEIVGDTDIEGHMLEIVVRFVKTLLLSMDDVEPAIRLWREHLGHREGDQMTVRLANGDVVEGVFAGLTDEGHLRLRHSDGERVIAGGDVIES